MIPELNKSLSKEELKELIKQEYIKCASSPIYFLQRYAVIQHPMRGKIKFELFNYQKNALTQILENKFVIVCKARQIGFSTLVAGYALWLMLFNNDKSILCVATKQDTAKNLVGRLKTMYNGLPSWLHSKLEEDNKLSLRFANGSQIKAVPSSPDAGRSESLSLLIVDEAAHIDNAEEIWNAASNALASGGQAILLSSPNGVGNFFHKEWVKATDQTISGFKFHPIFLDWKVHPDRNAEWRKMETQKLGEQQAAQEHDADFITTGNSFIPGHLIKEYQDKLVLEPIGKRGIDSNLWVWQYPDPNKSYIVSADCARGDGNDYSTMQIIDIESLEQVAEYRGKIDTKMFGNLLYALASEYNDALLVVENNTIGWAVIQVLIDRQYKNLFYMTDDLKYVDGEKQYTGKLYQEQKKSTAGFTTSLRTRPLILSKLNDYMRDKEVKIRSIRTINELYTFIWDGSKVLARDGYNDDLIMSLSIGLWVRDTALRLRQQGIELTKLALDKVQSTTFSAINVVSNELDHDPWRVPVQTGEMLDLREFL